MVAWFNLASALLGMAGLTLGFMSEGWGIGKASGLDSGFRGNFLHFRNHLILAESFKILDDLLRIVFRNAADIPAEFTMP